MGLATRGDGGSCPHQSALLQPPVLAPREEGEEGHAPRPPDEVTSGWDVFDPDDQVEHTIPTAPENNQPGGWDNDHGDVLLGGSSLATGSTANAASAGTYNAEPELSPPSPTRVVTS